MLCAFMACLVISFPMQGALVVPLGAMCIRDLSCLSLSDAICTHGLSCLWRLGGTIEYLGALVVPLNARVPWWYR